jgi:hypothetical protein
MKKEASTKYSRAAGHHQEEKTSKKKESISLYILFLAAAL